MATTIDRDRPHYTIEELARKWQVHRKTVDREVSRGRLAKIMIGNSSRFSAEEVARYELARATRTHETSAPPQEEALAVSQD